MLFGKNKEARAFDKAMKQVEKLDQWVGTCKLCGFKGYAVKSASQPSGYPWDKVPKCKAAGGHHNWSWKKG